MSKPAFDRTDRVRLVVDTVHNVMEVWIPGSFMSPIPLREFTKQREMPLDPFPKIPDSPQLPEENPNPPQNPPQNLPQTGSNVVDMGDGVVVIPEGN